MAEVKGWIAAGIGVGLLGDLSVLYVLGAVINGDPFPACWTIVSEVLCPAAIVLRGFFLTLAMNCVFFALIGAIAGLVWNRAGEEFLSKLQSTVRSG
ncbi:MAG TPA: hypothetical protein VG714_05265 [Acidobacteriaceae bacterium]|nr:hypothetical protein [Acidobacteriaceae bacterium]